MNAEIADARAAAHVRARLWDGPTRIVHWALVIVLAFAWWSAETRNMGWHRIAGYTAVGLVVFRLIWGFVGSRSAQFVSFVRGPAETLAYARSLPERAHKAVPGHNPLGAWSVVAILTALIAQVTTGLFSVDVDGLESGPLSDLVSFDTGRRFAGWHELSFTALQVLVVLHLVAVVFYAVYKRADLVRPMVTGHGKFAEDPRLTFAPVWRAVLVGAAALLVAWLASKGFRP